MAPSGSFSSSSSPSSNQPPFHQSPQQFHKAHRKANEVVQHLVALMQKGPRTLVATVVDTDYHGSQGYVLCTTQSGIVQVYGIPPGSVLPGMRVYCRQMGGMATNKQFVYDGPAAAVSSLGASGSLLLQHLPAGPLTSALCSLAGVPSSASVGGSVGYYWHCYFYISALPPAPVTLLQMSQDTDASRFVVLELLPSGLLQFRSQDGQGYISLQPIVPQALHWVLIQPGIATQELLIDERAAYSGSAPSFTGLGTTYTLSLLSNRNGTHLLPLGSWISKVGYGATMGVPLAGTFPEEDRDLLNRAGGTYVLLLCEDDPASGQLHNSASGSSTESLAVTAPATLVQAGPY